MVAFRMRKCAGVATCGCRKVIEFLLPAQSSEPLDALLGRVAAARGRLPFSELAMEFVGSVSRSILTDRRFRGYPELMAMADWFRPINLRDLRQQFLGGTELTQHRYLRRGVVFHIAPSNVDSVFIYSWLLSLLCGNANIARVSTRRTVQMQAFFYTTATLLQREEYKELADANLVLSYEHNVTLTEKISSHCQLRVIWGGDNTVRQIRAIPLPPLSMEIAFANRFSLAVIEANALLSLDRAGLVALAHAFYNDAFWFAQQACSSPRAVIWIGDNQTNNHARSLFWSAVAEQVRQRSPENLPGQVMNRTTTLFRLACEHAGAQADTPPGAMPSRILVSELIAEDRICHDGNGLFIEIERPNLVDIIGMLSLRDQTIAHFGFARAEWLELLADLPPHAADRIVPIGEALAFSPVWDGVNLLRSFTREVRI